MMTLNSVLDFFISSAHADPMGGAQGQAGGGYQLLIIMAIFVAFMYMTVWRPQSKRAKEHKELINSLAKGDEVVTAGGIVGKVSKISDIYVVIAINDTAEMTMQKSSISTVLPKGTLKAI
jgi:preprotein translocase subunit YajC